MNFQPESIYHVYNQGNNQQLIFFTRENYLFFIQKMRSSLIPYCDLLAYCLMPNHFHWLIKTNEELAEEENLHHPLVRKIANLLSSYAQAVNNQRSRSGSLFRSKTKSKKIEDLYYALTCFLYIHQNPLRAQLSKNLDDWIFSSYRDYAGIRNDNICNLDLANELLELPESKSQFQEFSMQTIPDHYLKIIF